MTEDNQSVASFLTHHIETCGKKQIDIAADCGFAKPNIISMIKKGQTPMPREKIPKMARTLGIDPRVLLQKVYGEYCPAEWAVIEQILGQPVLLQEEIDLINILRIAKEASPDVIPAMRKVLGSA